MSSDHPGAKAGFRACCLLGLAAKPRALVWRYKLDAKLKNHPIAQKTVPVRCSRTTSGLMCCQIIPMPNLAFVHIAFSAQLPSRGHLASVTNWMPNSKTTPSHKKQCLCGALGPHLGSCAVRSSQCQNWLSCILPSWLSCQAAGTCLAL